MLVRDLLAAIDERFPFSAAPAWDPVGLQVGGADRTVGTTAVCHEVTASVVDEAVDAEVGTLVSYHPLLFTPTVRLVDGPDARGRALTLATAGISVVVVHTAMDAASPGTGDSLLAALGFPSGHGFAAGQSAEDASPIGRVTDLDEPLEAEDIAPRVGEALGVTVRSTLGSGPVRRIAVVPGSGASFIEAAAALGAEALVTGDVSHHRARAAAELGIQVVDAGHAGTERPGVEALYAAVRAMDIGDTMFIDHDPTPWEG